MTGLETAFAADPVSVRQARRFVTDALHEHGEEALADVAALLVSELVTNALLHARTDMVVAVLLPGGAVRVEVRDGSQAVPVTRSYLPDASTGRGMILIAELADQWGCDVGPAGKAVWFELTRAAARAGV